MLPKPYYPYALLPLGFKQLPTPSYATIHYNMSTIGHEPLPETSLHASVTVDMYLNQLYMEKIVGFVIRQAWIQHQIGSRPKPNAHDQTVVLGGCISVMEKTMGFGATADYSRHTDPRHELAANGMQVFNLNTTIDGVSEFTIFTGAVRYSARLIAGDTVALLDYRHPHQVTTLSHTRRYSSGLYPAIPLDSPPRPL